MSTLTDFPVKHIDGNLIFGRDGSVWAYYEVEGFAYDHLDPEQKKQPFYLQMNFLTKNAFDIDYKLIPYRTESVDVLDRTMEDMERRTDALKPYGQKYIRNVEKVMTRGPLNKNSHQYHSYLGVQLDPRRNRYREGNAGTQFLGGLKAFFEGMNSPVRRAVGLEPFDILETELEAWHEQARSLVNEISAAFSSPARQLTQEEAVALTEYSFRLAEETPEPKRAPLAEEVEGGDGTGTVKAVRPNPEAYYRLQDALVIPYDHRSLLVKKYIDEEPREELVQFLVIDHMEPVNHHPGFEWIYEMQNHLPFPVGISIRACHKPNAKVRKELSNALLSYKDQEVEAAKARTTVEGSVSSGKAGAARLEEVFKTSGQPAYGCTFVIRVAAETRTELTVRVQQVKRMISMKGISVQSPYGEAWRYFMEFVPATMRKNEDYWLTVSPGILASMMFGATTNVGDNRGFLIGFTKKLKKPVYIQPDLAAKNFAGVRNLFDSLAVMVAGETGKGKSVLMNLFATLSALTLGSQVLVIDPKGDRKGWAKGLPFIPPEHISVWSIGENPEDAGSLDPFRTSENVREAVDITMDILSYLVGIDLEDDRYTILSDAVEFASGQKEPCLDHVMRYLADLEKRPFGTHTEKRKQDIESLHGVLKTVRKNQLAALLFGIPGQNYRALNVTRPLQVLMVQNLKPPVDRLKKPIISEKISEALLISMMAFTKQYMMRGKERHKVFLIDEAHHVERSAIGHEMIEFMERMGRHFNSTSIKGSQKARDYQTAAHIGMKFCFMQQDPKDAVQMLEYMNLPATESNVNEILRLERGECLFQDIYGRTAVISVNPIFQEILDAFDTSTATKEERAYEEKRKLGV